MPLRTTTKAGVHSDPTVWNSGAVPDPTDTLLVNHALSVPSDFTVGVLGAAGTGITLGAAGSLTVQGAKLTLGSNLVSTTRATVADSVVLLPSGASAGGIELDPPAGVSISLSLNQRCRLRATGDATGRTFIRTKEGADGLKGWITSSTANSYVVLESCDLTRLADSSNRSIIWTAGGADAGQRIEIRDCVFDVCGKLSVNLNSLGNVHVILEHLEWLNEVDPFAWLQLINEITANVGGTRLINECASLKAIVCGNGNSRDFIETGNYYPNVNGAANAKTDSPYGPDPASSRNFFYSGRSQGHSLPFRSTPGSILFTEPVLGAADDGNFHGTAFNSSQTSPYDLTDCWVQHGGSGGDGENFFFTYGGTTPGVECLVNRSIFAPALKSPSSMIVQTTPSPLVAQRTRMKYRHSDIYLGDGGSSAGGIVIGESNSADPGMIAELGGNLFWSATPNAYGKVNSYENPGVGDACLDAIDPAGFSRNAGWNFTPTKATTPSTYLGNQGNGYRVALSAPLGGDDLNADPQLLDHTRSIATLAGDFLGGTANRGAWANATAYAVGDVVEATTAGYAFGLAVQYRCVAAHTSDAASTSLGKPGSADLWRSRWEFHTLYLIRRAIPRGLTITDAELGLEDADYITACRAWLFKGHEPQNPAYHFGAADGGTYGAVEIEGVQATGYTLTGPTWGAVGFASDAIEGMPDGLFYVEPNTDFTGTITPSAGGGGGTFSPTSLTWAGTHEPKTFTYTPATAGSKTISTTNNVGLTNPASLTYVAGRVFWADNGPGTGAGTFADPFGHDDMITGAGNPGTCWAGVNQPGDFFLFKPGVYLWATSTAADQEFGVICPGASGTAAAPITYASAPGGRAKIIRTSGVRNIGSTKFSTSVTRHYTRWIGLDFEDSLIFLHGLPGELTVGHEVAYCRGIGDYADSRDNHEVLAATYADSCWIHHNDFSGVSGRFYSEGNSACLKFYNVSNTIVEDNYLHDSVAGPFDKSTGTGNIYRRNLIRVSMYPFEGNLAGASSDAEIYDNILDAGGSGYVKWYGYASPILIRNNLIFSWLISVGEGNPQTNQTAYDNVIVSPQTAIKPYMMTTTPLGTVGAAGSAIAYAGHNLYVADTLDAPTFSSSFQATSFGSLALMQAAGVEVNSLGVAGGRDAIFEPGTFTLKPEYEGTGRFGGTPGPADPASLLDLSRYGPDAAGYITPAATALKWSGPVAAPSALSALSRSGLFVVTPDGLYAGTATPSDNGAGGTFTPATLTWDNEAGAKSFTYTPASVGLKNLSITNSGGLANPADRTYNAVVTTLTLIGPGSGTVGVPSSVFTVLPNVAYTGIVTPVAVGGGAFSPTSLSFNGESVGKTFTYTPASEGTKTISITNTSGMSNPAPLSFVAGAPVDPGDPPSPGTGYLAFGPDQAGKYIIIVAPVEG